MYIKFTLFGYTFHISFVVEKSNYKILHEVTNLILAHKKLNAAKIIYQNFNITLNDTKKILENILHAEKDSEGNYHFVYDINEKKKIVQYLKQTLKNYGRK